MTSSDDTWIGLNDKTTEGTFEWIEDTSTLGAYDNWYGSNNPNSGSTTQSCVVKKNLGSSNANHGKWDDVGCNKDLPYACSMDAVTCGSTTTTVTTTTTSTTTTSTSTTTTNTTTSTTTPTTTTTTTTTT